MPLAGWDINSHYLSIGRKLYSLCANTLQLVIKLNHKPASEASNSL